MPVELHGVGLRNSDLHGGVKPGEIKLLAAHHPRTQVIGEGYLLAVDLEVAVLRLVALEIHRAEGAVVAAYGVGVRVGFGSRGAGVGDLTVENVADGLLALFIRLHLMRHRGDGVRNTGVKQIGVEPGNVFFNDRLRHGRLILLGKAPHGLQRQQAYCGQRNGVRQKAHPIYQFAAFSFIRHLALPRNYLKRNAVGSSRGPVFADDLLT